MIIKPSVDQKEGEDVVLRSHSPEVNKIITDLLACGVIGIEIAQIIDFVDQPSILLQSFEKKTMFKQLHSILLLIKKMETKGVGKSEAEKINILLKTIWEYYIVPVHAELFKHQELKAHVGILQETILEMRLQNNSISRARGRKQATQRRRSQKKPK